MPFASMHAIRVRHDDQPAWRHMHHQHGVLQSKPEPLTTIRPVDVPRDNSLLTRVVLFLGGYHMKESKLVRGRLLCL